MPYGSPIESRRDVRTLVLDLPRQVSGISGLDSGSSPIAVHGPLSEDQDPLDEDPIHPTAADIDGTRIQFTFDPPLSFGRYWVAVHQSNIAPADEGSFDLLDEDDVPWTGWEMQVLRASERQGPAAAAPETQTRPPEPTTTVLVDGQTPDRYELSGEVLTVIGPDPGDVELEVRSLWPGRQETLYHRYLSRTEHKAGGEPAVSFASAGPTDGFKWAAYGQADTAGRLPRDTSDGSLLMGAPVMREPAPKVAAPLIDENDPEVRCPDGHPNEYLSTCYTVKPQSTRAAVEQYTTRKIYAPYDIDDPTNTPETNPRLFPERAGYREELPAADALIGAYGLPLNSEILVKVGGQEVWRAQTRLIPAVVTPRQLEMELDTNAPNDDAKAAALRAIWQASMEALKRWKGTIPRDQLPTGTMREFVLTFIANGGIDRTAGAQGETQTSIGEQVTSAQSDRAGERRLARLAELLEQGEASAPLNPESHVAGAGASVGSEARNVLTYTKDKPLLKHVAPMFSPYERKAAQHEREYHRLNVTAYD